MSYIQYEKIALNDKRINEIFRLRFKVYCLECGYENACDYLNHQESDEYDDVATHFCACEADSSKIIGTARIILPSEAGLPVFNHFDVDTELLLSIPSSCIGEISRLAISKEYRRRMIDEAIYDGEKAFVTGGDESYIEWKTFKSVEYCTTNVCEGTTGYRECIIPPGESIGTPGDFIFCDTDAGEICSGGICRFPFTQQQVKFVDGNGKERTQKILLHLLYKNQDYQSLFPLFVF